MKTIFGKCLLTAIWYAKMLVIVHVCIFGAMLIEEKFFFEGSDGYSTIFALLVVLIFRRESIPLTKKERVRIWRNQVRMNAQKWNRELWAKNGKHLLADAIETLKNRKEKNEISNY